MPRFVRAKTCFFWNNSLYDLNHTRKFKLALPLYSANAKIKTKRKQRKRTKRGLKCYKMNFKMVCDGKSLNSTKNMNGINYSS